MRCRAAGGRSTEEARERRTGCVVGALDGRGDVACVKGAEEPLAASGRVTETAPTVADKRQVAQRPRQHAVQVADASVVEPRGSGRRAAGQARRGSTAWTETGDLLVIRRS